LSATFLTICLEILLTSLSFCRKLLETFSGRSGQSITPFNRSRNSYEPMFLFDNGISLCVGNGTFGSLRDMRDTRKVKMQPFSTSLRKNRSCLPEFRFAFDVREFVRLLDSTNTFGKQFIKVSTQYSVFKGRLAVVYKTDINGINIMKYLEEHGY